MAKNNLINRLLPLALILLILAIGFAWHIVGHQKVESLQKSLNAEVHNAEAKMLLGQVIIESLLRAESDFLLLQAGEKKQRIFWLERALASLSDIDQILEVYNFGGDFVRTLTLNMPGVEKSSLKITYQPPLQQQYNLAALSLRVQLRDFREKLLAAKDQYGAELSRTGKHLESLVSSMEENGNKFAFDARSQLHLLHQMRTGLLKSNSQAALRDAILIFFLVSALITLIYKQIFKTQTFLESSIKKLQVAEKQLNEKNEQIVSLNNSLEDKVRLRTEELNNEIVERKKIEDQLTNTRKFEAIGQLAGGIAHDFNNVLTIISGYGALVKRTIRNDEKTTKDMDTILNAAKKAEGLTRQLLAFSRKQVLKPTTIELNTFLHDSEQLLKRLLRENVEFQISKASNPVFIMADPSQMDQVLFNLIVNSRDAIGDEFGSIRISVSQSTLPESLIAQFPDEASNIYGLITVEDSGHGIAKKIQGRIFDPFFTTKAQGQGTGLGLSTLYGIIKQSSGYITLDSDTGCGTKFFIYLPLVSKDEIACEPKREEPLKRVTGKTILVVDDEEAVVRIVEQTLKTAGHTVIAAIGGKEAFDSLDQASHEIDLLLTDVGMPEINGLQLAERATQMRKDLPVLFASGYGDFHEKKAVNSNENMYFLQKPFQAEELLSQIDKIFEGK